MDPSSLENLLQAAAVDQLIGYEGNQTAHNLLQEVQGTQTKYPAYLGDLNNGQVTDNTVTCPLFKSPRYAGYLVCVP